MAKPLLFLDVDGVINCYGHPGATRVATDTAPVEIPPGVKENLHRLLGAFEPVWASAWRGAAHPSLRKALDLPEGSWPWLDWIDLKLPHIVSYAGRRPWAWVDDDARMELDRLHPAFGELPDTLIVAPDTRVGLVAAHVSRLLTFASRLGAG